MVASSTPAGGVSGFLNEAGGAVSGFANQFAQESGLFNSGGQGISGLQNIGAMESGSANLGNFMPGFYNATVLNPRDAGLRLGYRERRLADLRRAERSPAAVTVDSTVVKNARPAGTLSQSCSGGCREPWRQRCDDR
ncbi:hypothetical protein [Mycobacterium sp.]|uniref:hypothetical protein n=1 Tax=Mycobacterium sp. TaxID=1785 RepID=UPI002CCED18D|nr:hypothetical protein [Mycobacterium sp.]HTQ21212.1 hypothetical protein [Mycobacterium sp.]